MIRQQELKKLFLEEDSRQKALKKLRLDHDLTQDQLADEIGVCSRLTYSSIERGLTDGSVAVWKRIQEIFGLSNADVWELMTREATHDDGSAD